MMEFLKNIDIYVTEFIENVGLLAPLIACFLILIESMLPMLPLAVFITFNFYYFGDLFGFLISWGLTCLGCLIAFKLCRNRVKFWFDSKIVKKNELLLTKWMMIVNNIKFEHLVLLIAIPFTPAFLINIVAGVSSMSVKKFFIAILIGKIFMVYFWGFVGSNLLTSFREPINLVIIAVLMILAFTVSKLVNRKFGIE